MDLDLNDNTNQWGAHPAAVQALRAGAGDGLARYPELYADILRDAVAQRLHVRADCVTTGCGSDDVLDSVYRAVRSSDRDFVSVATPTFPMALALARMNGMDARAVPWPEALAEPEAYWRADLRWSTCAAPTTPRGTWLPSWWTKRT